MARSPVNADPCDRLNRVKAILLMRHAKHESAGGLVRARKLSGEGVKETEAVAERLKEHFEESGTTLRLALIIAADSDEAKATAQVVQAEFQPEVHLETLDLLAPKRVFVSDSFKEGRGLKLAAELRKKIALLVARLLPNPERGEAIMIVGHQPILGWLEHAIVKKTDALVHSEILCLDLTNTEAPPGLRWTISPSDPEMVRDLKEKIRSKMEVAKLLSSFLGGGLSFLLATMADSEAARGLGDHVWPFAFGSLGLLIALGLFLWTMCSYDTLLMPDRMWAETPRGKIRLPAWVVERPPSAVQRILHQNMMRIWQWQFIPATWLMLAGLFLLASAVFGVRLFPSSHFAWSWYSIFALWFATVIALKGWNRRCDFWSAKGCRGWGNKIRHLCGPWLGSED